MASETETPATAIGPRAVPWLSRAAPAVHGSFDASAAARFGLREADVLDFSANGNVLGPPPGVAAALAQVDLARYPDRGASDLRAALARRHALPESSIVPGNGSTELIWSIARAFLAPGDSTLVVGPTYGEYAAASAACGARIETCSAIHPGSGLNAELFARAMGQTPPHVAWLCHPNNPTGTTLPLDLLAQLAQAFPDTLFVVDEAYVTLCQGVSSAMSLIGGGNVVVLRSMTKDAALAGLRIGYAVATERVADAVRRMAPPWSVSSFAQAAALAALSDLDHIEHAQEAVAASRAHLTDGLRRLGFNPYPSVANFVLVPVGDGCRVTLALLERGFAVRDCTSFGFPDCIRIGVRTISDQDRLLAALDGIRDG